MTVLWIGALRAAHVVASSFWLGVSLLNAGFLLPAVQASGPAGGQVMQQLVQGRRLPVFLNAAILTTLVTGGVLFWWVSGGLQPAWIRSRHGMVVVAGNLVTMIAAILGAAGYRRPERPSRVATQFGAVLLTIAAAIMAVARYVP